MGSSKKNNGEGQENFDQFSPLNLGFIDYNDHSWNIEREDEKEIFEEEDFEDDEDSAFRTHAL